MTGISGGTHDEGTVTAAADVLGRRAGLYFEPAHRGRLTGAIRQEAERRGETLSQYVARLDDEETLQSLLDRITVQETSFFRDPRQFDALAKHVLPNLLPPIEVWSAGCANGQEPYSLGMCLDEAGFSNWRVVATDISRNALNRTRAARYADRELRGLSPARSARYLIPSGGGWEVIARLRASVEVLHHNFVHDPAPIRGTTPVVFCRNVLIYLGRDDIVRFLDRLADAIGDGYLFLGYSESLFQVTERFAPERLGDVFVYRAQAKAAPARPRRSWTPRPLPVRPRPPAASPPPPAPRRPASSVPELLAAGEAALTTSDLADAIAAFRRATFLDPDHAVAHLHLGLALEAAGDYQSASRAFSAARSALARFDTASVEAVIEGYQPEELNRLLDAKIDGRT